MHASSLPQPGPSSPPHRVRMEGLDGAVVVGVVQRPPHLEAPPQKVGADGGVATVQGGNLGVCRVSSGGAATSSSSSSSSSRGDSGCAGGCSAGLGRGPADSRRLGGQAGCGCGALGRRQWRQLARHRWLLGRVPACLRRRRPVPRLPQLVCVEPLAKGAPGAARHLGGRGVSGLAEATCTVSRSLCALLGRLLCAS